MGVLVKQSVYQSVVRVLGSPKSNWSPSHPPSLPPSTPFVKPPLPFPTHTHGGWVDVGRGSPREGESELPNEKIGETNGHKKENLCEQSTASQSAPRAIKSAPPRPSTEPDSAPPKVLDPSVLPHCTDTYAQQRQTSPHEEGVGSQRDIKAV